MTINEIYSQYKIGSNGFISAVQSHCGYEISADEIERIAVIAPTADEFQSVWENDDSWTDENNA